MIQHGGWQNGTIIRQINKKGNSYIRQVFSCCMNSAVPCLGKLIRSNKDTLFHLTAFITHFIFCTTAGTAVLNLNSSNSLYYLLYADTCLHDSRYCSA